MNEDVSECLRQVYEEFDVPADRVVTDRKLREEVAEAVRSRSDHRRVTTQQVMRQLLRLRKSGQLPRLRR